LAGAPATTPAAAVSSLEGTAWTLFTLDGRTPAGRSRVTLEFAGGRVQGSDGCNRYSGAYSASGAQLRIAPDVAATQMGCPAETMDLAGTYMHVLLGARAYRMNGAELQLLGGTGAVVATFAPQSLSLAGRWRVTGISNGRQAVAGVLPGTEPTLEFSTTGTVSAFAGCNRFHTTYSLSPGTISLAPLGSARLTCAHPPRVMEQERELLAALLTVSAFRLSGNRLELRRADGALALALAKD
jgi:heat shock protein HslJ